MTHEMLTVARAHARDKGFSRVEFRLGEIENLPIADATADVVMSNCVVNLSPEKDRVFREAFRVLRPGGRLAISDVVAIAPIPRELREDKALFTGCVSGAAEVGSIERMLRNAGFECATIEVKGGSREFVKDRTPGVGIENFVASAMIRAVKPGL